MYKKILESTDIEWMAILPLLLFVAFFVGIIIMVIKRKQSFIDKMANMPLEDNEVASDYSKDSDT